MSKVTKFPITKKQFGEFLKSRKVLRVVSWKRGLTCPLAQALNSLAKPRAAGWDVDTDVATPFEGEDVSMPFWAVKFVSNFDDEFTPALSEKNVIGIARKALR